VFGLEGWILYGGRICRDDRRNDAMREGRHTAQCLFRRILFLLFRFRRLFYEHGNIFTGFARSGFSLDAGYEAKTFT